MIGVGKLIISSHSNAYARRDNVNNSKMLAMACFVFIILLLHAQFKKNAYDAK